MKGNSPVAPTSESTYTSSSPGKKNASNHSNKPGIANSSIPSLEPKQRDVSGDEHVLLRLMQQGKFIVQNKGRQRIRPGKKKFSALKKRVLHERLQKWRDLHSPDEHATAGPASRIADAATSSAESCAATTVCVFGLVEPEELEDDDEYDEIVSNFRDMAVKIGPVRWLCIPRLVDGEPLVSLVDFIDAKDATAAAACWSGLSLGGQSLNAVQKQHTSVFESEDEWCEWCLQKDSSTADRELPNLPASSLWEIVLENALTEEDLEDDDCLNESISDIKALASRFGPVTSVRVEREPRPRVYVRYDGERLTARKVAADIGSVVIGGQAIVASIIDVARTEVVDDDKGCTFVILDNVLNDDDLEDEECLSESLADIRELAQRFGAVSDVRLDSSGSKLVRLSYNEAASVSEAAAASFNAMTIGGLKVVATVVGEDAKRAPHGEQVDLSSSHGSDERAPQRPMMTRDKRIPEQFAECLRVPKLSGTGQPRKYATLVENENVKPLLTEMLGELMRLQKRAVEEKNVKARRRLVMGLREVARGIRAHKVKLIVMANNLDEYGAIDEKLQEIIDLAFEEGVPVFFEFSKRGLGKVLGKSIKIGVVGVQSPEGAHQQFKKLLALAP
jgi:selenocysteine insertion sequence-binding protein 2